MRIWDISPAYLNRQSLLGEHRELHGLVSIMVNNKKGYSQHPETLRWLAYGWALNYRHKMLVAEMNLRGYQDKSPVNTQSNQDVWPDAYIDSPFNQLMILSEKYQFKEAGRLALPTNAQEIWRQHKYSVMARDNNLYKEIGKQVAAFSPKDNFSDLTLQLSETLRTRPSEGGIRNALQHMWGYISDHSALEKCSINNLPLAELYQEIQQCALASKQEYLCNSTALSEFSVWL